MCGNEVRKGTSDRIYPAEETGRSRETKGVEVGGEEREGEGEERAQQTRAMFRAMAAKEPTGQCYSGLLNKRVQRRQRARACIGPPTKVTSAIHLLLQQLAAI